MEDESKNILGFGIFFFIIVLIVVFGSGLLFFTTQNKKNEKKTNENQEIVLSDKKKIDKSKDFIYFKGEEMVSESLSIVNKYPVINLESESANNLNKELMEYVDRIKNTLQRIESPDVSCAFGNYDNIYQTKYLDYNIYSHKEYITLFIRESNYNCDNGISIYNNVRSYTFNVLTGERINTSDLLEKYNTTLTLVIDSIRNYLNNSQVIIDEEPSIKIDETIDNLKEQFTYAIYIDDYGDLNLNFVVKTNSVDYNDNIIING